MIPLSEIKKQCVGDLGISKSLLIRAAQKRGLSYKILPGKVFWIGDQRRGFLFSGTSLPCNNVVAANIANDKYLARQLLRPHGIPVPASAIWDRPASVSAPASRSLKFPLAVKPITASHGNGASMNVKNRTELQTAVKKAFAFMKKTGVGSQVLIEEFFTGRDLRFSVVGEKAVAVLERKPAYVEGDGRKTVRQLAADYNKIWRAGSGQYDLPLCPIVLDDEARRKLREQGRTENYRPARGETVVLRWNANVSTGGRTFDVTDEVHLALKNIAVKSVATLGLKAAGVDILCKDFRSPDTSKKNMVLLELNHPAGLDIHHFPYEGRARDVAGEIIRYIFETA